MKKMMKYTMATALVLITGLTAMAQEQQKKPMSNEEKAAQMTEHMQKNLNLTSEQAARVKEVNMSYVQKRAELHKEKQEEKTQTREKMQELNKSHNAELKQILNEEQYNKFIQHQQERKEGHHKGKAQDRKPAR